MSGEEHEHTLDQDGPSEKAEAEHKAAQDKPVSVLKGDSGLDTAQVFISAFLIVVVGLLACAGAWRIPLHGEDTALFAETDALHHVSTFPQALSLMPDAPLTLLGFALNWQFLGGVAGLHAVSLLLHLSNGVLLFLICRKMMRPPVREPMAMVAGMLFVLHPLAAESVCCLAARPSLQGAFFALLGLVFFLRAIDAAPRPGLLALSLVCYVLAFGSAALMLVLPMLFLGADCARNGIGGLRRNGTFHLAAFGILIALAVARGATGSGDWGAFPEGFAATLAAQSVYLDTPELHYPLLKLIAPMQHVTAAYPDAADFGLSPVGVLLLAALAGASAWTLYRRMPVGAALWWILAVATAAPCLIPLDTLLAERNAYFPLAGVALATVLLLDVLRTAPAKQVAGGLAAALVLACCVGAFLRVEQWRDPDALWTAAAQDPGGDAARMHRARYLTRRAALMPDETALSAARDAWTDAHGTARGDGLTEVLLRLGAVHQQLGDADAALPLLEEALRRDPFLEEAAVRLGIVHGERGRATGDTEAMRRSVDYFRRAERMSGVPPEALGVYALSLAAVGNAEAALPMMQAFAAGESADSNQVLALRQFEAAAEALAAREQEAARLFQEDPNAAAGPVALAETYLERSRLIRALYLLERAKEAHPAEAPAWTALGLTRALLGSAESFAAEFAAAPLADEDAWRALAMRCGRAGQWDAALLYLTAASGKGVLAGLPRVALADTALELELTTLASGFLEDAAEAHPENPEPWLRRCDVALEAGDMNEATRMLREAEQRGASAAELEKRRGAGGIDPSRPALPPPTVIR